MKILKVRLVNSNMSVAIDYEDSEGVEHLLIVGAEKVIENWQAVEHTLAPDGFPPSHRDDPFCECNFCMGFVSRKPAAGKA